MKPIIIINFKGYKNSSGKLGTNLIKSLSKVKNNNYEIILAPTFINLKDTTCHKIFSQHVDPLEFGKNTGSVSIDELKSIGIKGSILNHSEKKLKSQQLIKTTQLCKKKKFKLVICASSMLELKKIAHLNPEYIAYEPSNLIGGNISVTKAKPKVIINAVELVKKISPKTKLLVGAGIHSKKDISQALILGANGVLLSHKITKSKNPEKTLKKLLILK